MGGFGRLDGVGWGGLDVWFEVITVDELGGETREIGRDIALRS